MSAIATNAATIKAVAAQLAAWGWPSDLYPGWATRRNRQTPLVWESVTVHHTGAGPVSTRYMVNPSDRAALVVLCNVHITKDHQIRFLAAGGASHAGMSDRATYARMRAGKAPLAGDMKPGADSSTFSANRLSLGLEVDNAKTTPEWDEWVRGAVVALCAALHEVCGWPVDPAPRVITHKELTRRKPGDPIMDAGRLRSLVREFLAAPYGPPGSKPWVLGDRLLSKDGNDEGPDVAELAALLTTRGYDVGEPTNVFGPAMDKAVRDVQVKAGFTGDDVDGVVGPKTLAVLTQEEAPVTEPTPEPEPEPVPTPEPTPEPEPEPVPTEPVTATFRVGAANCQSYDGIKTAAAWRARAAIFAARGWSVLCLSETTEAGQKTMLAELKRRTGHTWKLWTVGGKSVCVMWDTAVWLNKSKRSVSYGTAFGHGAVCAPLHHLATGLGVDVISQHTRPGSVATDAQKDTDIAKGAKLAGSWPAIYAGDFARNSPTLPGWTRATPKRDTMDKAGTQTPDAVFVRPGSGVMVTTTDGVIVNPGGLSDHKWVGCTVTLTQPSTT